LRLIIEAEILRSAPETPRLETAVAAHVVVRAGGRLPTSVLSETLSVPCPHLIEQARRPAKPGGRYANVAEAELLPLIGATKLA
jgi:hypothetical protein